MKSIGFRASPKDVIYAIVEEDKGNFRVTSMEKIRIPASQGVPEQLSYLRTTIKDIISEYSVSRAGIRTTEASSRNWSLLRISIEAVIQELFCNTTIEKYFVGQNSSITAKLNLGKKDFKKIVESDEISECHNVDLTGMDKSEKEAVLVAVASLNL